jgi:hypothetical protein
MDASQFKNSLANPLPPAELPPALESLWGDAKGDWARSGTAEYWYQRAGNDFRRSALEAEWMALVDGLLL